MHQNLTIYIGSSAESLPENQATGGFQGATSTGGNANTLIIYPEDNLTIVVLTNLVGALPINFVDEVAALLLPKGT